MLTRNATLEPQSVDAEARTAEIIWSTGAAVQRRDLQGPYQERLSLDPAHVDLSRMVGASLLNGHQHNDARSVLGIVLGAKVDGQRGIAKVKFSQRPDVEPIFQDIQAGILRHVSVGYLVDEWENGEENGVRLRTAVRWVPFEISIVGAPADTGASIRGHTMDDTAVAAEQPHDTQALMPDRATVNAQIRSIAQLSGLDQRWIDGQIDSGADLHHARAAAFEAMANRDEPLRTQAPRIDVGQSFDDPQTRAQWMGEAVYQRLNPEFSPSEPARQFVGMTMVEMAKEMLRTRGIGTTAMSPSTVVTRALHTTSDFPIVFGNTINRTLRAEYEAAPGALRRLGRQTTFRDFRPKTIVQMSELERLEKLNEHGEYTSGTLSESKESYKIATYGKMIGITRHMLVNDDLNAFGDLSRKAARAARATEDDLLVALLIGNSGAGPRMGDGTALFHGDHGNLATSAGAPSEATLTAARLAMRKQVNATGDRINVVPRTLLIPPDLETPVEKLLTAITPHEVANVNPFSNLQMIVEPRFTDTGRWYVVANPATVDGLEYAYLEGEQGPQVESESGFEIDGVRIKVRLDFGAGFLDWRGWFQNAGA